MAQRPSDPKHVRRARIFLAAVGAGSMAIAVVVAAGSNPPISAVEIGFALFGMAMLLVAWLASDRWILRWEMLLTGWP